MGYQNRPLRLGNYVRIGLGTVIVLAAIILSVWPRGIDMKEVDTVRVAGKLSEDPEFLTYPRRDEDLRLRLDKYVAEFKLPKGILRDGFEQRFKRLRQGDQVSLAIEKSDTSRVNSKDASITFYDIRSERGVLLRHEDYVENYNESAQGARWFIILLGIVIAGGGYFSRD
ncbi:hypothetical protein [Lewinella sp. 4G2]|uniref:hypothetical protein n=1 Tax=Lewinella sp. 4G2 TaxID=1803372 RepID=UPI0007B4DF14|nr:hypothetical protein [Lewinella sp. 4G2]OAV45301.1 hypothetical protein A3850_012705 [Lewinella sp. 4G2]